MAAAHFSNVTLRQPAVFANISYGRYASSWDRLVFELHDVKKNMIVAARAAGRLQSGKTVVDLASGTGTLGRLAGEVVGSDNVIYVDKSFEMVNEARLNHVQKFPPQSSATNLLAGQAAWLDWCLPEGRNNLRVFLNRENKRVDVVFAGQFLNHIAQNQQAEALKIMLELAPTVVFDYYEHSVDPHAAANEHTILGVRETRLPAHVDVAQLNLQTPLPVRSLHTYVDSRDRNRLVQSCNTLVANAGARIVRMASPYDLSNATEHKSELGQGTLLDIDGRRRTAAIDRKNAIASPSKGTILPLGLILVIEKA